VDFLPVDTYLWAVRSVTQAARSSTGGGAAARETWSCFHALRQTADRAEIKLRVEDLSSPGRDLRGAPVILEAA